MAKLAELGQARRRPALAAHRPRHRRRRGRAGALRRQGPGRRGARAGRRLRRLHRGADAARWRALAADERSRAVVAAGPGAAGQARPDRAQQLLAAVPADRLDAARRGRVAYEIALWTVASYLPELGDAAERRAGLGLRRQAARMARARGDEPRRRRRRARRDREDGQQAARRFALAVFRGAPARAPGPGRAPRRRCTRMAAQRPSFHGWLAADRLRQPYALCPLEPSADAALRPARRRRSPGWRARSTCSRSTAPIRAAREWAAAVKPMSDDERRVAVQARARRRLVRPRRVRHERRRPTTCATTRCASRCTTSPTSALQSQVNALDPAWVAGADPRGEQLHAARALRRRRARADAAAARHRRSRSSPAARPALARRREPVRAGHQHPPGHRLHAPDARPLRRQGLPRHRRLQRRSGAGGALARRARPAWIRTSSSRAFRTRRRASTSRACSPSAWSTIGASTATPRR